MRTLASCREDSVRFVRLALPFCFDASLRIDIAFPAGHPFFFLNDKEELRRATSPDGKDGTPESTTAPLDELLDEALLDVLDPVLRFNADLFSSFGAGRECCVSSRTTRKSRRLPHPSSSFRTQFASFIGSGSERFAVSRRLEGGVPFS